MRTHIQRYEDTYIEVCGHIERYAANIGGVRTQRENVETQVEV